MSKPVRLQKRTVFRYELDFFLESEGGVEVDGTYIPFSSGDINFRKPGQIVQGLGRYHCYCLHIIFEDSAGQAPEEALPNQPLYDVLNKIPHKITGPKAKQMGLIIKKIHQHHLCGEFLLVKIELFRLAHEPITFHQNSPLSYNNYVKTAISYMNANYKNDINFETLAHQIGISKPYFFALFKQCTGSEVGRFNLDNGADIVHCFLRKILSDHTFLP